MLRVSFRSDSVKPVTGRAKVMVSLSTGVPRGSGVTSTISAVSGVEAKVRRLQTVLFRSVVSITCWERSTTRQMSYVPESLEVSRARDRGTSVRGRSSLMVVWPMTMPPALEGPAMAPTFWAMTSTLMLVARSMPWLKRRLVRVRGAPWTGVPLSV